MGDAICHGVEHLAKISDLVSPTGEHPIEHIGTFADDQQKEEDVGKIGQGYAEPIPFQIEERKERA
jgi:hypothetical protein